MEKGKTTSLLDVAYEHYALIKAHLMKNSDDERLRKQSLLILCKDQESMANRLVVVSAIIDDKIREMLEGWAKLIKNLEKVEEEKRNPEGEVKRMKEVEKKMIGKIHELEKFMSELAISRGSLEKKLEER
ncbi:hypothetical protein VNO78_04183 [Psophocarpus tetragonolobus]|uniref:Uncharacterized protein n=1 Tax=Psophocarpus tetragonolobus TaxID=3891 RepID=A0AAN9TFR7_PSOTE